MPRRNYRVLHFSFAVPSIFAQAHRQGIQNKRCGGKTIKKEKRRKEQNYGLGGSDPTSSHFQLSMRDVLSAAAGDGLTGETKGSGDGFKGVTEVVTWGEERGVVMDVDTVVMLYKSVPGLPARSCLIASCRASRTSSHQQPPARHTLPVCSFPNIRKLKWNLCGKKKTMFLPHFECLLLLVSFLSDLFSH